MRVFVRYDLPDENGETRRQKNDRLAEDGVIDKETGLPLVTPVVDIPDEYAKVWLTYFSVSNQVTRVYDGKCGRIPPSEFVAWTHLTGVKIEPQEYELLTELDAVFCEGVNEDLKAYRERELAKAKDKR